MKLRDLEAHFCKWYERSVSPREIDSVASKDGLERGYQHVETLAESDGIFFLCPLCFSKNSGPKGTHGVMVAFTNAPDGSYMKNKEGRWPKWSVVGGSTLDDLQLSPSIQLLSGCNWHGFLGNSGVPPGEVA